MINLLKWILIFYLSYLLIGFLFTYILYVLIFLTITYIAFLYSFKKIKRYTKTSNFTSFITKIALYEGDAKLQSTEINKEIKRVFKYNFIGRFWLKIYLKHTFLNINNNNFNNSQYSMSHSTNNSITEYLTIFELSSREELISLGKTKLNKRYKELSKKYHPDMPTGDKDKMVLLNEARAKLLLIV